VYARLSARDRDEVRGGAGAVLAEVLARLQNDAFFVLALSTTLQTAFRPIATGLEKRRIPWIALKGLLFGRTLYPSPDLRPMADLDFLVRPEHLDAASSVLEALGYARAIPPGRRATHAEMFERHYLRPAGAFVVKVEPHSGLGQEARYRVDREGLWERSVPLSRLGITDWGDAGRALSPEDNLAHLFLHQANAVFDEIDLRSVLDVHELISQWGVDWDTVLDRARVWRVATPMHLALSAARALMGTPVPERISAAVRPGPIRRAWLARFIDVGGLGFYRYADHPPWLKRLTVGFGSMDSPADAVRYALSYAGLRLRDARAGE
jgi:hypothetical protein